MRVCHATPTLTLALSPKLRGRRLGCGKHVRQKELVNESSTLPWLRPFLTLDINLPQHPDRTHHATSTQLSWSPWRHTLLVVARPGPFLAETPLLDLCVRQDPSGHHGRAFGFQPAREWCLHFNSRGENDETIGPKSAAANANHKKKHSEGINLNCIHLDANLFFPPPL